MRTAKRLLPRIRRRLGLKLGPRKLFTWDVSPGGLCVETMAPGRPGSDVCGVLELSGRGLPFTGKVAWSDPGDLRVLQKGRMGIRLTGISPEFYALFA